MVKKRNELKEKIYQLNSENKQLIDELNVTKYTSILNKDKVNSNKATTSLLTGYVNRIEKINNVYQVYNEKIYNNLKHYKTIENINYEVFDIKQILEYLFIIY